MSEKKPDLVYQIKDAYRRYYHVLCYRLGETPNKLDPEYSDFMWRVEIKSPEVPFTYTAEIALQDSGLKPMKDFKRELLTEFFMSLYDAFPHAYELEETSPDYKWAMSYEIQKVESK